MAYPPSDHPASPYTALTVPGLHGSGAGHWQSLWERARGFRRVEMPDWAHPRRVKWVARLEAAIRSAPAPVVLVAHSLGCMTVAWWAQLAEPFHAEVVAGALLVAPPDVDRVDAVAEIRDFAPAPQGRLPFPSILVGSTDDPYASAPWLQAIARDWGSHFFDVGAAGHVNEDSGLGDWPQGQVLLDRLLAGVRNGGSGPQPGRTAEGLQ